jgi:hypothetical protein
MVGYRNGKNRHSLGMENLLRQERFRACQGEIPVIMQAWNSEDSLVIV